MALAMASKPKNTMKADVARISMSGVMVRDPWGEVAVERCRSSLL